MTIAIFLEQNMFQAYPTEMFVSKHTLRCAKQRFQEYFLKYEWNIPMGAIRECI